MLNLVTDSFIRAGLLSGETVRLSLPEIFEAMGEDLIVEFTALRAHQRAGWHMLLVQLGALARHRSGSHPRTAEHWAAALLALAPSEAWDLIGADDEKPAFLQPPVSGTYDDPNRSAGALDMLVTSKNHRVKSGTAPDAEPDVWLLALVTQQTMGGRAGPKNEGISRMNSGAGSRPFVGLAPAGGLGAHVMRDIEVMLDARADLLERTGLRDGGHELLWLLPWDGTAQLSPEELAPWYVDVCRRVRLRRDARGIFWERQGSAKPRVNMVGRNGNTGDHWGPIGLRTGKLLTADTRGFSARVACDLLFPRDGKRLYQLPDAMRLRPGDRDMRVLMRVLVGGQGKTEGYYEREVPFRSRTLSLLRSPEGEARLAEVAAEHLQELNELGEAIRKGVAALLTRGDREKMRSHDKRFLDRVRKAADPVISRFEAAADPLFFERVQDRVEEPEAELTQVRDLIGLARQALLSAVAETPLPASARLRTEFAAERAFNGTVRFRPGRVSALHERLFPKRENENEDIIHEVSR